MSRAVIHVEHLTKKFRIPHERITTLRGAFVNIFKKKTYEEFLALDDVSFEVKQGEFFGIIGRNGSGKSTLLKILAQIYTPDTGAISISGLVSPFLELGIGFNPELSGRDNIYLNATVLGLSKKQINERFKSIVEFSEMERFIDQKIKNYSSGMQVRLAFAVAIHANREILLMDEVLAVGDTNFQQKCIEEFNRYRKLGKTVILVTHDLGTLQRYCDRAMLLRNGKVEKIADPDSVVSMYMYQNMNDEQKRLSDEQERERNKQLRSNPYSTTVDITDVKFLDAGGEQKRVFRTGDNITARIYYHTSRRIEKPVFGVALHTQNGVHISGPNTKTSRYTIDAIEGDGYIDFTILSNPFFTNYYQLTVALFNWDCTIPFAYKDRAYQFKIISAEVNQYGVMNIQHEWNSPAS